MTNIDVKIRNPYNNCILRKTIYHQYLPMLIGIYDLMGAQTDRLRCEVSQNLILSPMNTGPLRPAVATAPTVYGIETLSVLNIISNVNTLQQYLPFTVCAAECETAEEQSDEEVRTSLVPEGREDKTKVIKQQCLPFTVLKPEIHLYIKDITKQCCNRAYRLRY